MIILSMLYTLGTINDRDLSKLHDESEIQDYKAILLSPGRYVSLSCILAKSKLGGLKINNETSANAGKLLYQSVSRNGIVHVLRFKTAKQYRCKSLIYLQFFT